MDVESFLAHYGLMQNPFDAEEARHDSVLAQSMDSSPTHPQFGKIFGQLNPPSTSVVFGEKGSGKTAIRLMIAHRIKSENQQHPDQQTMLVVYDDLNPMLDAVCHQHRRGKSADVDVILQDLRLEDHQDAILSIAVTKLVDIACEKAPADEAMVTLNRPDQRIRKMPRRLRVATALLAVLYDQQQGEDVAGRWIKLRRKLRCGGIRRYSLLRIAAWATTILAAGLLMTYFLTRHAPAEPLAVVTAVSRQPALLAQTSNGDEKDHIDPAPIPEETEPTSPAAVAPPKNMPGADPVIPIKADENIVSQPVITVPQEPIAPVDISPTMVLTLGGTMLAATVVLWLLWLQGQFTLWRLCRKTCRAMPTIKRTPGQLRQLFAELPRQELVRHVLSIAGMEGRNSRYQLTHLLIQILGELGFTGIIVVVDRVDEPTLVTGMPQRMRSLIWPMLDNKFLQQDGLGFKMLLPIELSHILHRESPQFFQEARLDKQRVIDPLTWSGATLYDLCTSRLRVCMDPQRERTLSLTDLFETDVTRQILADALDQMRQPRDAFKFLYQVIQEHCRMIPQDQACHKIARPTLEMVRRSQSQRVDDLFRGLTPA